MSLSCGRSIATETIFIVMFPLVKTHAKSARRNLTLVDLSDTMTVFLKMSATKLKTVDVYVFLFPFTRVAARLV